MILLDANLVSEPLKLTCLIGVFNRIDAQIIETLYLSTISLAKLHFGTAALSLGKRRDTLHTSLEQSILPLFAVDFCHLMRRHQEPACCCVPVREPKGKRFRQQSATSPRQPPAMV